MYKLYIKEQDIIGITCNQPSDLLTYFNSLKQADQESFWVVTLDAEHKIIACDMVALGGPNYAQVSPNIVFRRVLENKGVAMVVLHNHPSGNPTVSENDRHLTEQLKKGAKLLEIKFLDHLLIAERDCTSIK